MVDYYRLSWSIEIKSAKFYQSTLFDEMIHYWPTDQEFDVPYNWDGQDLRIGLMDFFLNRESLEVIIADLEGSCDLQVILFDHQLKKTKEIRYFGSKEFVYGEIFDHGSLRFLEQQFSLHDTTGDFSKLFTDSYPLQLKLALLDRIEASEDLLLIFSQESSFEIKQTIVKKLQTLNAINLLSPFDQEFYLQTLDNMDDQMLWSIVEGDPSIDFRINALEHISTVDEQKLRLTALNCSVEELRLAEVAMTKLLIANPALAEKIFFQTENRELRLTILDHITNERRILQIAVHDEDEQVRWVASRKLSLPDLIDELMVQTADYWIVRDYIEGLEGGKITATSVLPSIKQDGYEFDEERREQHQDKMIRIALYQLHDHIRRLAIPRIRNQGILVDLFTQERSYRNKELVVANMYDLDLLASLLLIADENSRDMIRDRLIEIELEQVQDEEELREIILSDANSKLRYLALLRYNVPKPRFYLDMLLKQHEDENIAVHCLSQMKDDDMYIEYLEKTLVPRFIDDVLELIEDKHKLMKKLESFGHPLIRKKVVIHLRLEQEITKYILRESYTRGYGMLRYIQSKELLEEILLKAFDSNIRLTALHRLSDPDRLQRIYEHTSQIDLKYKIIDHLKTFSPKTLREMLKVEPNTEFRRKLEQLLQ